MPGSVFLPGDRVALRTIEEADLPFLQRARNHPAIRRQRAEYTPETDEALEEAFEEEMSGEDGVHFLVTRETSASEPGEAETGGGESDPEPVGFAALAWIDDAAGTAFFEAWLAPGVDDHAAAVEAHDLLATYAFAERRLHKISTWVHAIDRDRQVVLEDAGFRQEARIPEEAFVDGEYVDVFRYGLLADEWRDEA